MVKGAGTPVNVVVDYVRLGLAPEKFTEEVHPALLPACVYDALSYYYDHRSEIDREIAENTEEVHRLRLAARMRSEEDYQKITGRQRRAVIRDADGDGRDGLAVLVLRHNRARRSSRKIGSYPACQGCQPRAGQAP